MARGDRHALPERTPQGRGDAPLVLGVAKCEQEGHGDRLGSERLNLRHHALHLGVSERLQHAGRTHALRHAEHVASRDQRGWVVPRQVVQRRAVLSPEPQQVLEAARGYQHHPRAAPLEQRVSRDRRAVDQDVDRSRQKLDRPKHSHRGIVRCRHDLADRDLAVVRERDEVSEGATDVDADPHRHCPTQLRIADCGLRIVRVGAVTHDLPLQIRNPKSTIRIFTPRAPISSVAPPTRRRTPGWPALPASPPSRRGGRRACARRS